MHSALILAAEAAAAIAPAANDFALGRGAVAGAMIVGLAFVAALMVLRSGPASFAALLMVGAASALQAAWLGLIVSSPQLLMVLQALFGGALLLFVAGALSSVRRSRVMSGILFTGALSIVSVSVLNAVIGGEASGVIRSGLYAVGGLALLTVVFEALRGDGAARLMAPALALAAGGALLGLTAPAMEPAPQAAFAIGVLAASFAALLEAGVGTPKTGRFAITSSDFAERRAHAHHDHDHDHHSHARQHAAALGENKLAQVLDYAGIAVWDWSPRATNQSCCFSHIMGADCDAAFSPEAIRPFIHHDDLPRFEREIFGEGDGKFDLAVKLHHGGRVRIRGARAVDRSGAIERLVVFLEEQAPPKFDAAPKAALSAALPSSADRLKADVVRAIDKGEIEAAFQPIQSFKDGSVAGYEALLRWPSAETGVSTEDVLKAALAAGRGKAIGSLMLSAALRHAAERARKGEAGTFTAFNASLSQLREPGFVDEIRKAVADNKLPSKSLVIEVIESESLASAADAPELFKKLKLAGVALAFDDFGAGMSSIADLHKFQFDYLKIDKSLISGLAAGGDKKKIAASLAALGAELGLTVIAEGVETKEMADAAQAIGCKLGQGYHFGAPALNSDARPWRAEKTASPPPAKSGPRLFRSKAPAEPAE